MHTVFYEVFFISDKQLFYVFQVFERNGTIETKAAIFFKKVRGLN